MRPLQVQGFTLVELLVAIAVLGVLISVAVPTFNQTMAQQRLRSVASELRLSLSLARSEAVKRAETITMSPRSTDWSLGWAVTAADGEALSEFVMPSGVTLSDEPASALSFNRWGRTSSCPAFELATTAGNDTCQICLQVTTDGRVLTTAGTCPESCATSDSEHPWGDACS